MKFSIVTICLNAEKTIHATIHSVLNQTFRDFEYIIQDGDSTDNTLQIIEDFDDPRIVLQSMKDRGISDAFNKGIMRSNGEYILLLSADDKLYDSKVLENVVSVLGSLNPPPDVLHGNAVKNFGNLRQLNYGTSDLKYIKQGMIINHSTCFVKNGSYQKWGFFKDNFKIAMDYELILRFYQNKAYFYYANIAITEIGMKGISSVYVSKSLRESRMAQIQNGIPITIAWFFYVKVIIRLYLGYFLNKFGLGFFLNMYRQIGSINKKIIIND